MSCGVYPQRKNHRFIENRKNCGCVCPASAGSRKSYQADCRNFTGTYRRQGGRGCGGSQTSVYDDEGSGETKFRHENFLYAGIVSQGNLDAIGIFKSYSRLERRMVNKQLPGTALVTGASKRIGQAIALMLASAGYKVALHYHYSQKEAQITAGEIKKLGAESELFDCDLANEPGVSKLLSRVYEKFPDLNLLVNSASIFEKSKFDLKDLKLFNDHFAINLKAPFILSCEFYRLCKMGHIINLLDTNIVKNKTSHVAYLLTKKSLADLTKLAAIEFAPHIRVNGIAPGLILPPRGETPQYLDRMAHNIPLRRKGDVSYIAQSVKFLLENDYLTGQFLFNDGGEHLCY